MVTTRSKTVAQLKKSNPKTLKKKIVEGERAAKALDAQQATPPKSPPKGKKKGRGRKTGWNKPWPIKVLPSSAGSTTLKYPGLIFNNHVVKTSAGRGGGSYTMNLKSGCKQVFLEQKPKGATYGVRVPCKGKGCPKGRHVVRVGGKRGAHANTAATRYDARRKTLGYAKRHPAVTACRVPAGMRFPPIKSKAHFEDHAITSGAFKLYHTGAKARVAKARQIMEKKIKDADKYAEKRKKEIEKSNAERKKKGLKPLKTTKTMINASASAKKQKARDHFAFVKQKYRP